MRSTSGILALLNRMQQLDSARTVLSSLAIGRIFLLLILQFSPEAAIGELVTSTILMLIFN